VIKTVRQSKTLQLLRFEISRMQNVAEKPVIIGFHQKRQLAQHVGDIIEGCEFLFRRAHMSHPTAPKGIRRCANGEAKSDQSKHA
jgi:hypothetical protein